MKGALPPNRYELSRNCFITELMAISPLVERLHFAPGGALVELARTADLVLRVGYHLLPLGNPADRAGEREDAGEHRDRNAERALHDARVEVHLRGELALDAATA